MTQKEPLFIISKEVLYNKCYLHGYNRKVWETMDPVVLSRPYNEQEIIPNLHSCLHKEIRNGIEFCHYYNKEIHATLTEHDEKIRQAAIMECRSLVFNRVTKGECPFGGDCGRCFLCDNAGGCIVITEEARRTDVKAAINGVLDQVRKELRKEYSAVCGGVDWDSIEAVLIRLRQQSGTDTGTEQQQRGQRE